MKHLYRIEYETDYVKMKGGRPSGRVETLTGDPINIAGNGDAEVVIRKAKKVILRIEKPFREEEQAGGQMWTPVRVRIKSVIQQMRIDG